jgi:putative lipoprotein
LDFRSRGIHFLALIWLLALSSAIAGSSKFITANSSDLLSEADSQFNSRKVDRFLAADKAKHFTASLISTVFLYKIFEKGLSIDQQEGKIYSFSLTISLGLSKEIYDKSRPGNYFSWKDLLADAAGIAAGLILINQP